MSAHRIVVAVVANVGERGPFACAGLSRPPGMHSGTLNRARSGQVEPFFP
jgi:hypothetical protein